MITFKILLNKAGNCVKATGRFLLKIHHYVMRKATCFTDGMSLSYLAATPLSLIMPISWSYISVCAAIGIVNLILACRSQRGRKVMNFICETGDIYVFTQGLMEGCAESVGLSLSMAVKIGVPCSLGILQALNELYKKSHLPHRPKPYRFLVSYSVLFDAFSDTVAIGSIGELVHNFGSPVRMPARMGYLSATFSASLVQKIVCKVKPSCYLRCCHHLIEQTNYDRFDRGIDAATQAIETAVMSFMLIGGIWAGFNNDDLPVSACAITTIISTWLGIAGGHEEWDELTEAAQTAQAVEPPPGLINAETVAVAIEEQQEKLPLLDRPSPAV